MPGSRPRPSAIAKDYRSASLLNFPQWPLLVLIPLGAVLLGLSAVGRLYCGVRYKPEV